MRHFITDRKSVLHNKEVVFEISPKPRGLFIVVASGRAKEVMLEVILHLRVIKEHFAPIVRGSTPDKNVVWKTGLASYVVVQDIMLGTALVSRMDPLMCNPKYQ